MGATPAEGSPATTVPGRELSASRPCRRNEPCRCGSGRKYKRCCREQDESAARKARKLVLVEALGASRRKLQQFEKYACGVFGLPRLLGGLRDGRRRPNIPTLDVVNSLFHAALFRLPSINALEGDLKEADFQRLLDLAPRQDVKAFSAEVVSNVLDKLDLDGVRLANEDVIQTAERNKAFRDDSHAALRCAALDGWEPFASYDRHCPHCLVRKIKVKDSKTGEVVERDQYYHRYVVAMLLGVTLDLVLAIEPVRNEEARRAVGEEAGHEGELTAALRLIDKLHERWGSFIDALVFDALYANGPLMTKLDEHNYGGFIVLKKDNNEPLKEALALWGQQPACQTCDDPKKKEHLAFWDVDDVRTLDSYKGKVRVVRAIVEQRDGTTKTWCFAIVGKRARRTGRRAALKIIRSRWHVENTAFHQWVSYWNLSHVYRHTANAVLAVLLLWSLAFNLLQLFVYRRLKRSRRPLEPCDTIRHIVEAMHRDLATLPAPIPWSELADSS